MASSGMLRHVVLVRIDVSEERSVTTFYIINRPVRLQVKLTHLPQQVKQTTVMRQRLFPSIGTNWVHSTWRSGTESIIRNVVI
jgi:hypothetical protein